MVLLSPSSSSNPSAKGLGGMAFPFALIALVLGACGVEPEELSTDEAALNNVDVELEITIEASYADRRRPLELCIGSTANCYRLPRSCRSRDGRHHFGQPRTCIVARDLSGQDHPLVSHPDDWDHIFLRNRSRVRARLRHITITLRYGGHEAALGNEYRFVDHRFRSASITRSRPLSFDAQIRELREEAMEDLTGMRFSELPWMVRAGAHDIGQVGIVKYKPWDTSSQNGCDEFYNHFASQYSNNILSSCGGFDCSYFSRWTTTNSFSSLGLSQFINASRAYKVVFRIDRRTGNRRDIDGIYRCANADCSAVNRRIRYRPKIGDFFLKNNHPSIGNFHVMMFVGDFVNQSAGGAAAFDVNILHKSTAVKAHTWNISSNYINARIAGGSDFKREFYFGEADHDALVPVGRGSTSGARPWEMGPNAGHRATMISLYQ